MQQLLKTNVLARIWRVINKPFRQLSRRTFTSKNSNTYYDNDPEGAKQKKLDQLNTWEQNFDYTPEMTSRIRKMLSLIEERNVQSLMDLGCGRQVCGKILADRISYYPVDLYRHLPDTIVKDLNAGEFLEKHVDVIFCSGVLEYIYDLDSLLEKFDRYGKFVLCSYCDTDSTPDRASVWVNHLSHLEFVQLFQRHGFTLSQEIVPSDEYDHIYFFEKQNLSI